MACFNPFDWVLVCVGLVLKNILIAFTKYGLIAQVPSASALILLLVLLSLLLLL